MEYLFAAYPPAAWAALLGTGILIGLLAGLLGVGGGIVAVPILLEIFEFQGVAETQAVPLAVGTAQASILIASITAAAAHWRAGTVDRELVRTWLPALMVGAIVGLALSPLAPTKVLTTLFAVVAAALALKMAAGDRLIIGHSEPRGPLSHLSPALVGGLAAAVGVGGGTLSTPVLTLFSFSIKRAIGAGALFNLLIAVPATLVFLHMDLNVPGRPADALGDVAMFCVAALSLPALFVAPIAARWSARVPVSLLRRLFALCLAIIAVRLLLR
ncbi:sulfite exporter TauE/SafE family protein [Reyranella sp.]|uniref:sulfite exporter TauE/SafE family protein n=1 Tax=Reyranella sp. TaxID=1929291 RepID=UPI003C7AA59D